MFCKENFVLVLNCSIALAHLLRNCFIAEKSSSRIYILMEARLCELYKTAAEYEIIDRSLCTVCYLQSKLVDTVFMFCDLMPDNFHIYISNLKCDMAFYKLIAI